MLSVGHQLPPIHCQPQPLPVTGRWPLVMGRALLVECRLALQSCGHVHINGIFFFFCFWTVLRPKRPEGPWDLIRSTRAGRRRPHLPTRSIGCTAPCGTGTGGALPGDGGAPRLSLFCRWGLDEELGKSFSTVAESDWMANIGGLCAPSPHAPPSHCPSLSLALRLPSSAFRCLSARVSRVSMPT